MMFKIEELEEEYALLLNKNDLESTMAAYEILLLLEELYNEVQHEN